ncbi:MAG: energy-coupling factor transporter transmembrane component T [Lachnospiraceae bacterium]|nr:energy-coupling factor transporter transmembrane component T [Lachnospiraceae bacterium]
MEKKMRFDSYHPMINFIYFTAAIAGAVCFDHPAFLAVSYICAFLYSVKLNGKRSFIFNICLVPLILVYTGIYSYYNHYGVTKLRVNFIGNQITLEAVAFGFVIGMKIAAVLMILSCVFTVVSSDKIIYLFGRISPKLSLFLSILLRSVPRIKARARRIGISRSGIGKGCAQGNVFERIRHICALISILITWTLEDFVESAASMKCRGYSLRGRTAFSIYRFDNRDRGFVIASFAGIFMMIAASLLDQTHIYYNPEIIMNRITMVSFIFYAGYACFLLLPMLLQMIGETRFKRCVGAAELH